MINDISQTRFRQDLYDLAQQHNQEMKDEFPNEIAESVKNSKIYRRAPEIINSITDDMEISFTDMTTSAAIIYEVTHTDNNVAALNFASYKHPGGGFIKGAKAQEEMLCHDSNLFNILGSRKFKHEYNKNQNDPNKGLYYNFAIYSPDVMFIDEDNFYKADILTCAAPNWGIAKSNGISYKENYDVLKERCDFILRIALDNKVDTLILGAWGCGVFQQDPNDLSKIFNQLLKDYKFKKVVFAIPDNRILEIFKNNIK